MNLYTYVHVDYVVTALASGLTNVVISQQWQMSENESQWKFSTYLERERERIYTAPYLTTLFSWRK